MTRERTADLAPDTNVAEYFGHGGILTAQQIRDKIQDVPDGYLVNIIGSIDEPKIVVCTPGEKWKFSQIG
jgi:hypothetical protein